MVKNPAKNSSFDHRSGLLSAFLLVFFCAIVYRMFSLQILHGSQARALADQQHGIYQKLLPSRGEIKLADSVAHDTVPVATNLKSFLVYAVPKIF